ncbi:hypothetical protein PseudUWO310_10755 [Pseudanabaena sp. UWO310]|nr:hypothetical protein PseudUWO310_10755 [Pseudanabaena sp. UWO310]
MAIALNLLRANKDHKFMTIDGEMVAIDEIWDLRFNEVPNIKPESVARRSRATDSGKSGLVSYFLASPYLRVS